MQYMSPPKQVNYKLIVGKNYCLAPSKYSKLDVKNKFKNVEFKLLSNLITASEERAKIDNKNLYGYIEIGDIDTNTGSVNYEYKRGFEVPTKSPLKVNNGDILISTVRTYRKGITYINKDSDSIVCTPAFFIIRSIDDELTKEYLYAVLRHNFFVEQILSLQNRGIYPRLDKDTKKEMFIPIPKDKGIIEYITKLIKLYISKDVEIRNKYEAIIKLIHNEISENQKSNKFSYSLPTFKDLLNKNRLSAKIYSENYERKLFSLTNYHNGFTDIVSSGYGITRGQNLQISAVGTSIYSSKYKESFYKLILSKNITQFMTIGKFIYLGNPNELKSLKEGQILFTCRGDMGRCIIFCEDIKNIITNIDNVHIENTKKDLTENIFTGLVFTYLKSIGFIDLVAIAGSGADSFTKSHFSLLKIPSFSRTKKEEIAKLYYNPVNHTKEFGIAQLDKQMKDIIEKINETIDAILEDRRVIVDFSFLNA